ELIGERVVAGGKIQEPVLTSGVGRLRLRSADSRERDADAGESAPLFVRHIAKDVARQLLRDERAAEGEEREADDRNRHRVPHGAISHGSLPPLLKVSLWDG